MVDLNINIKVPAIEKLLDYAASGIGAVAGPMLAPWKASREGKAELLSARTDAEAKTTQAESEGEALRIIANAQSDAKALYLVAANEEPRRTVEINHRHEITQWIEFQERKRLANIKSVISNAADVLADKKVADYEPDPDWTARFFNYAQDISSEEMQKIWAKILAGEVEHPGKISLRTIDTLKNMTRKDAELFEEISGFVLDSNFIFHEESRIQGHSAIKFDNILDLQDCGLIKTQFSLVWNVDWDNKEESMFRYQGRTLEIVEDTNTRKDLEIPAVFLTTTGKELFSITRCKEQMKYLQDFSRFLQVKNCQLFYLEDIESLPGGQFKYSKRTKIEPNFEQPAGPTT